MGIFRVSIFTPRRVEVLKVQKKTAAESPQLQKKFEREKCTNCCRAPDFNAADDVIPDAISQHEVTPAYSPSPLTLPPEAIVGRQEVMAGGMKGSEGKQDGVIEGTATTVESIGSFIATSDEAACDATLTAAAVQSFNRSALAQGTTSPLPPTATAPTSQQMDEHTKHNATRCNGKSVGGANTCADRDRPTDHEVISKIVREKDGTDHLYEVTFRVQRIPSPTCAALKEELSWAILFATEALKAAVSLAEASSHLLLSKTRLRQIRWRPVSSPTPSRNSPF